MHTYYDDRSDIWVCECNFQGRKFVGEGASYNDARQGAIDWYYKLINDLGA
jgi:hypothetical protein